MNMKKFLGISLLAMSMSTASFLAYATPNTHGIKLKNYSYRDSTSRINDGDCSSDLLGEAGITRARQPGQPTPVENNIDATTVWVACMSGKNPSLDNCKADVFMDDHCGGNSIATVFIDTENNGVKHIDSHTGEYTIQANGYEISLTGGPGPIAKK